MVTALSSMKRTSASLDKTKQGSPDQFSFSSLSLSVESALQLLYLNKKPAEKLKKEKKESLRRGKKGKPKDSLLETRPGGGEHRGKEISGERGEPAAKTLDASTESGELPMRDSVHQMMDTLEELARAEKLLRKKIKKAEKKEEARSKDESGKMTDSGEQERNKDREMLQAYREQLERLSSTKKTLESLHMSKV